MDPPDPILASQNITNDDYKVLVGLDFEWQPNISGANRVAQLQLCFNDSCLLYQIGHIREFLTSLLQFLVDEKLKFVGVNVRGDVDLLLRDYGLVVWYAENKRKQLCRSSMP